MPKKMERDVPNGEHKSPAIRPPLDWESAHIFLEISRWRSFRSASAALDQSVNALRRQLARLERQLGMTLFTRHVDGVRLTQDGERIAAIVQRMEINSFDIMRATGRAESPATGEVRIAVTEGLGTFWLVPRLIEFQRGNPNVVVDMQCAMAPADVLRLEADVAVQLVRPLQKDVRVVKVGRLHTMPFAAQSYVATHGVPKAPADLSKHTLVVQVAEQVTRPDDYIRRFAGGTQVGRVSLRTNVSSAHYWAVAMGAGIGMLPTYSQVIGAPLVPIDIGLHTEHDIWVAYHSDSARIPRIRRLIDWLIGTFSPQRFAWFSDAFVHPSKLPHTIDGMPQVNVFAELRPGEAARAEPGKTKKKSTARR